ncbi:unnamed protein product [Owenia fusiformis]|uniref:Protein kinase domain-containing protein n=1 Tax=Owenia fusiformis TaxID=6347 RepID=A0A8S4PFV9_OWEFU|nr:unnamed protein product [Owenia fusiformis]
MNVVMQKYRVLGKKGEGTFSEVLKCQSIKDGTYYACKKMKQHYDSIEQVNNLREIQAMRRLSPHTNILELNEVVFDKKSGVLALLCELMDMNIYELIRGRRHYLSETKVKSYMYQLCKSIDHMHRNGIFHRDVKPENILIKDELLKLADFGSCRSVYSKQPYTEYISTRWYRAPECLLTDGYYTHKMDMWSVGCVFFEILSLHPLFPGSNEVDQIAKIHDVLGTPDPSVLNKLRNKTRGMNFNFPSKKGVGIEKYLPHASQSAIELIYDMCAYDPDERMSAKQALKHSYFKELRDADKRQAQLEKQKKEKEKDKNDKLAKEKEDDDDNKDEKKDERDAERRAAGIAKVVKSNEAMTKNTDNRTLEGRESKIGDGKSDKPGSASTEASKSISIINKETEKQKKEKRRKRRKQLQGENTIKDGSLLPKVPQGNGSFNNSFSSSNTTGFPRIANAGATSTTVLPSITTSFKPKAATKTSNAVATKNMYGHYSLPSIDRRGAGY